MTWLYIPPQCLDSAPEAVPSSSDSTSRSVALAASATWREKRMPPPYWSRAWKRANWLRRLSGATLEVSRAHRGVESWISSLRATRASRTAAPAGGSERPTIAGCSIRFSGSSTKCGLVVSSARTSRGTPPDSSPSSFRHWKEWATALRRVSSARWKSAPPTSGSDCSSSPNWRSPTDESSRGGADPDRVLNPHPRQRVNLSDQTSVWRTPRTGQGDYQYDRGNPEKPTPTLEGQAKHWPTPDSGAFNATGDTGRARRNRRQVEAWGTPRVGSHGGSGNPARAKDGKCRLEDQVMGEASPHTCWPTPAARDHKGPNSERHVKTAPGRGHMDQLPNAVEHSFSPPDPEAPTGPESLTPIPFSSLPSETSSSGPLLAERWVYRRWAMRSGGAAGWRGTWTRQPRRSLNPWFVEWLMGRPLGWTVYGSLATALSPWKRRMRTALSTLCSPPPAQQLDLEDMLS